MKADHPAFPALSAVICTILLAISPSGASAQEVQLRMGHAGQPTEPLHILGTKWAELLNSRGAKRISMKVYPQGQLGDEKSLVEQLRFGTVDATMVASEVIVGAVPELSVIGLPFAFGSFEQANKFLDGPGGKLLAQKLDTIGLKTIGFVGVGFRAIGNKVRPIRVPDDLKGLKIREIPSPLVLDTISALGGSATPLPWTETIPALNQGVVDGVGTSASFYWSAQLYQYTKFFTYTQHSFSANLVLVSAKTFNKLPPDLQKVVLETGLGAVTHTRKYVNDIHSELTANLEAKGVAVNSVNLAPFRERVQGVWRAYEPKIGSALMGHLRAAMEK